MLKPGAALRAHDLVNNSASEREKERGAFVGEREEEVKRNALFRPAAEPSPDFKC